MPTSSQWSHPDGFNAVTGEVSNRSRSWSRTAGFTSIPKIDLPINPYNDGFQKASQSFWGGYVRYNKSNGSVSLNVPPQYAYHLSECKGWHDNRYALFVGSGGYSDVINAATVKALLKVSDAKANLLVSAKEAAKTSDLILGKAKTLFEAYKSFRKGQFKKTARLLNLSPTTIHNSWLEYKYGWMPLVQEVKGVAEFFAQNALGRRESAYATGTEKRRYAGSTSREIGPVGPSGWPMVEHFACEIEANVKIWYELTSPHLQKAQELGITNPLLYAWEVIPFSFVFDWFISVGDYLTALSSLHGVTVKKAMSQVIDVSSYTGVAGALSVTDSSFLHVMAGRDIGYARRNYLRNSITVDPSTLYPPVNSPRQSWQRLISGCALLRGQTQGYERRSGLRL